MHNYYVHFATPTLPKRGFPPIIRLFEIVNAIPLKTKDTSSFEMVLITHSGIFWRKGIQEI